MRLIDDYNTFTNLLKNMSRDLGIFVTFIQKDYFAISILKELISRNNKFVFKGGTSLSVCQKVINRFSEDIDISYEDERITVGTRKQIKQMFFDSIESISLSVSNADNIRSRRVFNRYLCPYKDVNGNVDQVIVEWATQTPSFPIETKTAQTMIGQYLDSIGRHDLTTQYGLEAFEVKTITKERTLVDKIFAVCDYHLNKKLERQSRHIYDIHQLLDYVSLDVSFIELFLQVREYRKSLDTCLSSKEGMAVSTLLLELIEQDTYKKDYNSKTFPLLYDHVKYEDCLHSIKKIADFLANNNL